MRERFAGARSAWLAVALALAFVAAFRGVFCPHLSWRLSSQITLSEQAASVLLPTGGADGLALGAWGPSRSPSCNIRWPAPRAGGDLRSDGRSL